jgi:hypothetical protein
MSRSIPLAYLLTAFVVSEIKLQFSKATMLIDFPATFPRTLMCSPFESSVIVEIWSL